MLGLLTGLPGLQFELEAMLATLLVGAMYVADHPVLLPFERHQRFRVELEVVITDQARFVAEIVREAYGWDVPEEWSATVATTYRRTTLVDRSAGLRLTVDRDLVVHLGDRRADLGGACAIVESKSAERRPSVHRHLLTVGARPRSLSKYCLGVGALVPDVPANRWNWALRQLGGALISSSR